MRSRYHHRGIDRMDIIFEVIGKDHAIENNQKRYY